MGRRVGERVIVERGLAARGQKAGEGVGQPQGAEDFDRGFATVGVGFGVKQRNVRR